MEITVNFPDELARQVGSQAQKPTRVALETLALEGYRTELLFESVLWPMFGFETRMDVHAFLKNHGIHLSYDVSDLNRYQARANGVRPKRQDSRLFN